MPLFTVIVPVFNAEKTLERCLDSLLHQTEGDFEVLMVENGSQDASAHVCKQYAALDSRFHVISMAERRGPSAARNAGLEQAAGEWIVFADSDDAAEPGLLRTLREAIEAEAPDAVFYGYRRVSPEGQMLSLHLPEKMPGDKFETLAQLSTRELFGYPWCKALRRAAIGGVRFPADMDLLEDEVFTCQTLTDCGNIAVVPRALYSYTSGSPSSLTGKTHPDYPQKRDRVYRAWQGLLENSPKKTEILAAQANAAALCCMYYCFERNVPLKPFAEALGETEFFRSHTQWSRFDQLVRERRYAQLQIMRAGYRLKIKLARLLRR